MIDGLVRPAYPADIVVFYPHRVIDRATHETPHQHAVGISHVLVDGALVVDDDRHPGARPGLVLKGPGAAVAR